MFLAAGLSLQAQELVLQVVFGADIKPLVCSMRRLTPEPFVSFLSSTLYEEKHVYRFFSGCFFFR